MAHLSNQSNQGQDWPNYWRNRPLPILDVSKSALQQMLRRADRVKVEDVAEVVLADPLLTLNVLRYMGQRPRSSLSAEVVSIQSIVMMMGVLPFLERFNGLTTVEGVLLPVAPAEYAAYLQIVFQSRFTARLSMLYADWRYDARLDEIQVAGLLAHTHSLLEIVGRKLDKQLPSVPSDMTPLLARLMVPSPVVQLLGALDDAPVRIQLQGAVIRLLNEFNQGWWQEKFQQELTLIAGILNAEASVVWQALCKLALQYARDATVRPSVKQAIVYVPMIPGEWPSEKQAPVKVAPIAPKAEIRPVAPTENTRDLLSPHLQALQAACKKGTSSKDILALSIRALHDGLQMRRVVFVLVVAGKPELRSRFVLGVENTHPLRAMMVRTDKPHLFNKILEKPQSIWINPTNRAQFSAHLPTEFKACFISEDFFVMSIFVGTKALGLIVVDQLEASLNEQQYQKFKQVCLMTTRALTQSVAV